MPFDQKTNEDSPQRRTCSICGTPRRAHTGAAPRPPRGALLGAPKLPGQHRHASQLSQGTRRPTLRGSELSTHTATVSHECWGQQGSRPQGLPAEEACTPCGGKTVGRSDCTTRDTGQDTQTRPAYHHVPCPCLLQEVPPHLGITTPSEPRADSPVYSPPAERLLAVVERCSGPQSTYHACGARARALERILEVPPLRSSNTAHARKLPRDVLLYTFAPTSHLGLQRIPPQASRAFWSPLAPVLLAVV
jgi:hypothetical protein